MSTLVQLKYGYDQAGSRTYRRDEAARAQSAGLDELYGYDGLNRLTSMDRGTLNSGNTALVGSPTLAQDWTLDATGNWKAFDQAVQNALAQTREHNSVNEITGISETVGLDWAEPAYDANGNTTTIPQPGALDESYTGVYDAWNRLVKLTDNANSGATLIEYQYDGLNRRIAKTTPSLLGPLVRHAYFSDRWQVLEERLGSSTAPDQQFVWGVRYVDDLVLRDRFDITPGYDNRHYALQDALFSVVALADDTGEVKERFSYQPYGQSEALDPDFSSYSGVDTAWQTRFTGRELDLESGMQINRKRYLHLQLGEWMSRDSLGYTDGPNLYTYAGCRPLYATDPFGTSWRKYTNVINPQTSCLQTPYGTCCTETGLMRVLMSHIDDQYRDDPYSDQVDPNHVYYVRDASYSINYCYRCNSDGTGVILGPSHTFSSYFGQNNLKGKILKWLSLGVRDAASFQRRSSQNHIKNCPCEKKGNTYDEKWTLTWRSYVSASISILGTSVGYDTPPVTQMSVDVSIRFSCCPTP